MNFLKENYCIYKIKVKKGVDFLLFIDVYSEKPNPFK